MTVDVEKSVDILRDELTVFIFDSVSNSSWYDELNLKNKMDAMRMVMTICDNLQSQ